MVERIHTLIEQHGALTIRRLTDLAAENDVAAEPSISTTMRTRARFPDLEWN